MEFTPICHDPIPGFDPFLSYSNSLPLGKSDQNGVVYIGKCSTQVGNYGNGGTYIGTWLIPPDRMGFYIAPRGPL